jgi:hypothetical protein
MTYTIINIISECLSASEKSWFLKYFQHLAEMGTASLKKEKQPQFAFVSIFTGFLLLFLIFINLILTLNSH